MRYLNINISNLRQETLLPNNIFDEKDVMQKRKLIESVTGNSATDYDAYKSNFDQVRIKILENILKVYQKLNPILFYVSLIAFVVFAILNIFSINKSIEELIILLGLIALYLSRIVNVTFTYKTMYTEALNYLYLSNIYSVQIIFGIITIYFLINKIKKPTL